ncbi:MAG: TolC family protein [Candidatus Marinimicrobia bacterium]|nr:TolC family protein [Candidatus Neomarinimicrobiota bacterium]
MPLRQLNFAYFGWVILVCSVAAQENTVSLTFDQIAGRALEHSPEAEIIRRSYDVVRADQALDLQWTNPSLGFSQEVVGDQPEQYLILSKAIEMPWVRARRRQSWQSHIEAVGYTKDDQTRRLISELKVGYIKLKLLETQLVRRAQLKEVIVNVSGIAQDQLTEGTLSGVDQHLIQTTLFNINAGSQAIELMLQSVESQWKVALGIDALADLQLLTAILFQPVALETTAHYLSLIPGTPGYRQREMMVQALKSRIRMEWGRVIPYFNIFGGTKWATPSQNGYVAGISIPLPVLNRNRALIHKQQIELEITVREFERFQQSVRGQIETVVLAIRNLGTSLAMMETNFDAAPAMIASALVSYQEGWMSLTELLSAIQIHDHGIQQYFSQLTDYYQRLLKLEALTGQILVTFSAQGGDRR